jgi:hypothetical protein
MIEDSAILQQLCWKRLILPAFRFTGQDYLLYRGRRKKSFSVPFELSPSSILLCIPLQLYDQSFHRNVGSDSHVINFIIDRDFGIIYMSMGIKE